MYVYGFSNRLFGKRTSTYVHVQPRHKFVFSKWTTCVYLKPHLSFVGRIYIVPLSLPRLLLERNVACGSGRSDT